MPELTGIQLWWLSLAIAGVVVLVVVLLLSLIIRAANRIDRHAKDIWEVGKKIAANTVSIWMLEQTNGVAAEILSTAKSIAEGAGAINAKLDGLAGSLGRRGASP